MNSAGPARQAAAVAEKASMNGHFRLVTSFGMCIAPRWNGSGESTRTSAHFPGSPGAARTLRRLRGQREATSNAFRAGSAASVVSA